MHRAAIRLLLAAVLTGLPVAAGAQTASPTVESAQVLIQSGQYADAKTQLTAIVQTHPDDAGAQLLLGVVDSFLGDAAGAVAAYDKAGTIPDTYRNLAAESYERYASAQLGAHAYEAALAAAQKAVALVPDSFSAYNARGLVELNGGDTAAAVADLQKTQRLAQQAKAEPATLAIIASNLLVAQIKAGDQDAAVQTANDVVRLDPSRQAAVNGALFGGYETAALALIHSGKIGDAVAGLEAGATTVPVIAGRLYAEAAVALTDAPKPDWKRVKAEADKSLAADPGNGIAAYVAALALGNSDDLRDAKTYIDKAKASAAYQSDASFAKEVDTLALRIQNAIVR